MNYKVIYDGMFTTVVSTEADADNDEVFISFGSAREKALEYARTMRNDMNQCINDLKRLRKEDVESG